MVPGRTGGGFPGAGAPRSGAGGAASDGGGGPAAVGGGGGAGFLNSSQSNAALNKALQADAGTYTWAAATVNSNNAAGYQLGSGEPVMAIGGFNGTDPAPTLAQFEKYVAEGKIHYFIAGGRRGVRRGVRRRGGRGGSRLTPRRSRRGCESHFTAETVGGVTVYDLTIRRLVLTGESRRAQPSSSR